MNKSQILAITVSVAIAIAVAVVLRLHQDGTLQLGGRNQMQTEKEELQLEEVYSAETKDYFEAAQFLTIEKVVRTSTDWKDGRSETSYDSYLVGDVDTKEGTSRVQDFSESLKSEELSDEQIVELSFEEAFGFEYQEKTGWEILEALLKTSGVDCNLKKAILDKEMQKMTEQNLYVLDSECSILKEMLEEHTYDKLVESKMTYQTMKTEQGIVIPECFNAVVCFEDEEKIVTRNTYLEVTVNSWEVE